MLELSDQFSNFDDDDGRSSRCVQNDEDEMYFEELGNEFRVKGMALYVLVFLRHG